MCIHVRICYSPVSGMCMHVFVHVCRLTCLIVFVRVYLLGYICVGASLCVSDLKKKKYQNSNQ